MKTVLMLSGGASSEVLLAYLNEQGREVVGVTFTHDCFTPAERASVIEIVEQYDIEHEFFNLRNLNLYDGCGEEQPKLRELMIIMAAAFAAGRGIPLVAYGAVEADDELNVLLDDMTTLLVDNKPEVHLETPFRNNRADEVEFKAFKLGIKYEAA